MDSWLFFTDRVHGSLYRRISWPSARPESTEEFTGSLLGATPLLGRYVRVRRPHGHSYSLEHIGSRLLSQTNSMISVRCRSLATRFICSGPEPVQILCWLSYTYSTIFDICLSSKSKLWKMPNLKNFICCMFKIFLKPHLWKLNITYIFCVGKQHFCDIIPILQIFVGIVCFLISFKNYKVVFY